MTPERRRSLLAATGLGRAMLGPAVNFYNEDQPRDHGKFSPVDPHTRYGDSDVRPTDAYQASKLPPAVVQSAKAWAATLTPLESLAVNGYTHSLFKDINHAVLAVGGNIDALPPANLPDPSTATRESLDGVAGARLLDSAFAKQTPHAPMTCWRSLTARPKAVDDLVLAADYAAKTGGTFTMPVFGSATLNPDLVLAMDSPIFPPEDGKKRILLEIISRTGLLIGASGIGQKGSNNENEILQHPRTQYKVHGWKDVMFGDEPHRLLQIEEMPTTAKFYNEDQPRDHGKFAPTASGEGDAATTPAGDPRVNYGDSAERPTRSIRPDDLPAAIKKDAQAWAGQLSTFQRKALKEYARNMYTPINQAMRDAGGDASKISDAHTPGFSMAVPEAITHLANAAALVKPHARPLTCWRNMLLRPEAAATFHAAVDAAASSGGDITMPVFGSASLNPAYAASTPDGSQFEGEEKREAILLEIRSRTGMLLGAGGLSIYPTENEILQPPTAKYKVMGWKDVKFGSSNRAGTHRRILRLEEVPPPPARKTRPQPVDNPPLWANI
jgi:hypothetical protein